MILQALKEYYDRKASNPENEMPSEGFEQKELPFLIVIDNFGNFVSIEDTREPVGKKMVGRKFIVPRASGRSGSRSFAITNLLWDHIGYVLGIPRDGTEKSAKLAFNQHETWIRSLEELPYELRDTQELKAITHFYEKDGIQEVLGSPQFDDCKKIPGCNISFRLKSEILPVPSNDAVRMYVLTRMKGDRQNSSAEIGTCLVTGEKGEIARIHGQTPINKDSRFLVSFQKGSGYDSYGKEQGLNAPVIKSTEFAYVTALNWLLQSKTQRMLVGDAHTVFWGNKENKLESHLSAYFQNPSEIDPDSGTSVVRELFDSVKTGAYTGSEGATRFYVLGLAPNSARIAIRFWEEESVNVFSERIKQYFEDFSITGHPEFYSLYQILKFISPQDDSENLPPSVAGDLMRAILEGALYPAMLFQVTLNRIRSDVKQRATRVRAAVLKAYLNRYYRFYPENKFKEITMALDKSQPSAGYQLGRLFATLEKIQERASPGLNSTIRERYYGAACAAPDTVFPTLLRLKNHHLAKLENNGIIYWYEGIITDIMGNLNGLPSHLGLHEQGMFAIGYYHQRQDFFTKKSKLENEPEHKGEINGE